MTNIFKDATILAGDIAAGTLDAADLMEETYAQIAAVNGEVNAIHALLPLEEAVAQAREASGPLGGLPLAVKDLANAAGFPTTMGSPIFASDAPAAADDLFIKRLRDAGAVVIGKTNTPEFGLGSHSTNPVHGVTRNPWDLSRTAGGSSGGAAAALSTGMVPIADGSDMMGSLRNPAGWTNTYGLRPSFGLVPSEPVADTFLHQISTNGPMGRSPQDIELLMRVMSGPDPRQPHGRRPRDTAAPQRIAWLGDWGGAFPMEEGLLETCERALSHFTDCDCYVEPLDPPFSAEALWESWTTLRSWTVGASLAPLMADASKRALLKPAAIWEGERGLALSAMDVHRASVTRSEWFMAAATLFETYDALLLPTAQMWPFPAEWDWPREIAEREMDTYHRWMEVTVPASLLGLPALSLPAGFSEAGLPIGMQLIGPRGSDIGLLDLGQSWHLTVPWAATRPPVVRASEPL